MVQQSRTTPEAPTTDSYFGQTPFGSEMGSRGHPRVLGLSQS